MCAFYQASLLILVYYRRCNIHLSVVHFFKNIFLSNLHNYSCVHEGLRLGEKIFAILLLERLQHSV